jgi:hypothetical protein
VESFARQGQLRAASYVSAARDKSATRKAKDPPGGEAPEGPKVIASTTRLSLVRAVGVGGLGITALKLADGFHVPKPTDPRSDGSHKCADPELPDIER